jgi:hypothetical protein
VGDDRYWTGASPGVGAVPGAGPGGYGTGTLPPPPGYGAPPGWYGQEPLPAPPTQNNAATLSLIFGLCSALVPLLSIPGIIFGTRSLGQINQCPSLRGRGRSIAGIITSAVLGPLSLLAAIVFFVGGLNPQMNMPRVRSGIEALLDAQIQQHDGFTPDLRVQCPNSEPRKAGTVFSCGILVVNNGARFTTQISVTDRQGDYLVGDPVQVPGTAVSPAPATSVPPTQPVVPAAVPAAPAATTGTPTNGQVAVISVDASGDHLALYTGAKDVTYSICSQFQSIEPGGSRGGISALSPGDFATATIDTAVPCISQVTVLAAPSPPQCNASGLPGSALVTWEGFNQEAHSVLYLPTGSGESIVAGRWCTTPTVEGPDNSATTFSKIAKGAQVQLLISGDTGWVTSVIVKQ